MRFAAIPIRKNFFFRYTNMSYNSFSKATFDGAFIGTFVGITFSLTGWILENIFNQNEEVKEILLLLEDCEEKLSQLEDCEEDCEENN